jgi:hypothetical protein
MRTTLVGSLLLTAALLTGCTGSGEHNKDFVPMGTHNDMDVNIWDVNAPAKALYPTSGTPAQVSSDTSK